MKITKELLLLRGACPGGVADFDAAFGDGGVEFFGDERDIETLAAHPRFKKYIPWFAEAFLQERLANYSPDLTGDLSNLRGEVTPDLQGAAV